MFTLSLLTFSTVLCSTILVRAKMAVVEVVVEEEEVTRDLRMF